MFQYTWRNTSQLEVPYLQCSGRICTTHPWLSPSQQHYITAAFHRSAEYYVKRASKFHCECLKFPSCIMCMYVHMLQWFPLPFIVQLFYRVRMYMCRYERIFGYGYCSTGGPVTTEEFVSQMDLKTGQKVLDIGCGTGGGDFYMVSYIRTYAVGPLLSLHNVHTYSCDSLIENTRFLASRHVCPMCTVHCKKIGNPASFSTTNVDRLKSHNCVLFTARFHLRIYTSDIQFPHFL